MTKRKKTRINARRTECEPSQYFVCFVRVLKVYACMSTVDGFNVLCEF